MVNDVVNYQAQHFLWQVKDGIGQLRLNIPKRKNPLTFESYAEMRDLFLAIRTCDEIKVIVLLPNQGNFCSGGDVHDIIGALVKMDMRGLLNFTRMTGDLVKAMLHCNRPIIAAVDGIAAGAGAILAMASDLRIATMRAKTAFLFSKVGLAACDMGACAILPRIIGQGRAAELLFSGRSLLAEEGLAWGFYNHLTHEDRLEEEALALAEKMANSASFGHSMTKTMLVQEWSMSLDQALEAEAQAQAIAMQTQDFRRAYEAFIIKETPVFKGD